MNSKKKDNAQDHLFFFRGKKKLVNKVNRNQKAKTKSDNAVCFENKCPLKFL